MMKSIVVLRTPEIQSVSKIKRQKYSGLYVFNFELIVELIDLKTRLKRISNSLSLFRVIDGKVLLSGLSASKSTML